MEGAYRATKIAPLLQLAMKMPGWFANGHGYPMIMPAGKIGPARPGSQAPAVQRAQMRFSSATSWRGTKGLISTSTAPAASAASRRLGETAAVR